MKAIWSDNDSSSSEDEELEKMANFCLMAIKNEDYETSDYAVSANQSFDELHNKFQKIGAKYLALKKSANDLGVKVNVLSKEKNVLKQENNALLNENLSLKKDVEKFSNIAFKLTDGKENLEKLLVYQRQTLFKHVLGYNIFTSSKNAKTIFVKQGTHLNNACNIYGDYGHISYASHLRLHKNVEIRRIWVPKGTILPTL